VQWQTPEQSEITRLNRQLDAGHLSLRFGPVLESAFRADYERAANGSRTVLIVLAFVMIAATPFYDVSLLKAPPEYARLSHLLQWCLMLPALGVNLILQRSKRVPDLIKQSFGIGSLLAVWAGLTAQRVIAGHYDFHFPHDYGVIAIIGGFAMSRLRFYRYLPWAALMLLGSIVLELTRWNPVDRTLATDIYNCLSMTMMWVIGAAGAWLFEHVSRGAWLRHEMYHRLAVHDGLTGLSNRHHFQAMMQPLIRRAAREQKSISVMLIDIDHFKAYNDHYGHIAGDDCLRRVGAWLSSASRQPLDLRARLGGEEFVAVWYGVEAELIAELADDLRDGIARLEIAHASSPTAAIVTASAGLVHVIPDAYTDADLLMRSADTLLYAAKEAGRNRLDVSFGSFDPVPQAGSVLRFPTWASDTMVQ
jgi:diguanylate cyclase (GGDEF)-like protein